MANTPVLECHGLRRRFGDLVAVDGVGFQIAAGETYGLLGPNGAGKTTTISMIAGLLERDAGEVTVAGRPMTTKTVRAKSALGYVPQDLAIYPDLSGLENLLFFARLYGMSRAQARARAREVLEVIGLADRAKDATKTYSGGMKRRLNVGLGLLNYPKLLVLDEPTVGVDPQSRNAILESVAGLSGAGMAVLYTTHYMEEAERLCDRVLLVDHGRVVAAGTPAELTRAENGGMRLILVTREPLPAGWLDGISGVRPEPARAIDAMPERGHRVAVAVDTLAAVSRVLERAGGASELLEFHVHRPDLEDVFLRITGRGLRD